MYIQNDAMTAYATASIRFPQRLIGITGPTGAGKPIVANQLTAGYGCERVKFADPLESMFATMLSGIGHGPFDIGRYLRGDLKE
jgi:hypothetical protein